MSVAVSFNSTKTENSLLNESTEEYVYLRKVIDFFLNSQGIDNLNQAITIIKNYDMSKLSKIEKDETGDLLKNIEQIRDRIILSVHQSSSSRS